jgi:hypothetical protein
VRHAVSDEAADRMADMKKQGMAEAAEQLLAGTGWLPALLRTGPASKRTSKQRTKQRFVSNKNEQYQCGYHSSVGQLRFESASAECPTTRDFHDQFSVDAGHGDVGPNRLRAIARYSISIPRLCAIVPFDPCAIRKLLPVS